MKKSLLLIALFVVLFLQGKDICPSINRFGFDLLTQIDTENENLVISPYSIYSALAMTAEGADCETLWQMREVLNYEDNPEFLDRLRCLQKKLNDTKNQNIELSIANALYLADDFTLEKPFASSVHDNFSAQLMQNSFDLTSINNWVNEKTKGKIPTILDELDPLSKLVLLNAIYFKGEWSHKFEKVNTGMELFTVNDGDQIKVNMMHQVNRFLYAEYMNAQFMKMNYKNSDYAMLVILPEAGIDPQKYLAENDILPLLTGNDNFTMTGLKVSLPRFKIEYKRLLNKDLKKMGMGNAFKPTADFSRINKNTDLFIDIVMHKGFIEVNEEGAEAAAATAVGMKMLSAGPPRTTVEFTADHPFIFLITQRSTGLVLFSGIVNNPTKDK